MEMANRQVDIWVLGKDLLGKYLKVYNLVIFGKFSELCNQKFSKK